jgi:m7GpppX diphosphatase
MAAPSSSSEVPFGTSLAPFSPTKILRFERGGKLVVIQGRIGSAAASASPTATTAASASATVTAAAAASAPPPNADSGAPAILQLEQRAVCGNPSIFLDSLPSFSVALTNHSGAEYSYYEARGLNAVFDAEVIWPASARQIARKTPAVTWMCEESAALYQQVVAQHAQEQAANAVWLEAVVKLEKERERNLFANDRFIINVDTKWKTHGPLTEDATVRVGWCGAPWTADLYLLAIVADPALKSIRDLRGEAGAALCAEMLAKLRAVAMEVYGVGAGQLRIFFHYHPQFYRLHAHCTRLSVNPGCETERAHLLTTVATNLRLDPDYYAKVTLTYRLKVGEGLHQQLVEAGRGIL